MNAERGPLRMIGSVSALDDLPLSAEVDDAVIVEQSALIYRWDGHRWAVLPPRGRSDPRETVTP